MDTIYKSVQAHESVAVWCEARFEQTKLDHDRSVWRLPTGDTHVLTAGRQSDRPPVVFVPGTNFNAAACLPEIAVLARRHRVVAVDVPGQPGLSRERRVRNAGVVYLGAWLAEVLDVIGRPVTVVGHSLGAAVALASRSPLICARVLVSPAGLRRLRTPVGLLASSVAWLARPTEVTTTRLLLRMCASGQAPTPTQVEWMTLVGRSVRTSLDPGRQPGAVFAEARERPVLVATGVHDVFVPPSRLERPVREDLRTHVVPLDCGHLLTQEAWNQVSDWIAAL